MATTRHDPPQSSRVTATQWFIVLGPLLAAFTQQQLPYILVARACAMGSNLLIHLSLVLTLGVAGAAIYLTRKEWQSDTPNGRFFSSVACLTSGIGMILLLAEWLPALFFDPCVR